MLDDEEDELYQIFLEKVCLCGCSYCVDLAPHPVKSCVLDCLLPGTVYILYYMNRPPICTYDHKICLKNACAAVTTANIVNQHEISNLI